MYVLHAHYQSENPGGILFWAETSEVLVAKQGYRQAAKTPKIKYPPIKVFHFSVEPYQAGIEEHVLDGVGVKIYSREKTIVDCFKFRQWIGVGKPNEINTKLDPSKGLEIVPTALLRSFI